MHCPHKDSSPWRVGRVYRVGVRSRECCQPRLLQTVSARSVALRDDTSTAAPPRKFRSPGSSSQCSPPIAANTRNSVAVEKPIDLWLMPIEHGLELILQCLIATAYAH